MLSFVVWSVLSAQGVPYGDSFQITAVECEPTAATLELKLTEAFEAAGIEVQDVEVDCFQDWRL